MKSEAAARERKVLSQKAKKQKSSTARSLEEGGWWRGRGKTTNTCQVWWFTIIIPEFGRPRQTDFCERGQRVTELHMYVCPNTHMRLKEKQGVLAENAHGSRLQPQYYKNWAWM